MNIQQLSLSEYHEHIISKQSSYSSMTPDTHKELISQFHFINKSIQYKLQQYTKLISVYLHNVQDKFLLSFAKVLEKMGNDLMLAQQAYKSIDKEVMTQQKCLNLTQDKIFFINQSNYYQQQFLFKSKQADKLKEKNYILIKQNTGLKEKLFEKVKQNMFLKQKIKKFYSNQVSPENQPPKINNNEQTLQISPSKKMIQERLKNSAEKKWSSYGRQTEEERRQKEEEKNKEKKSLLINIRKQLKTREKINLDQIINRSFVQRRQEKEILPHELKKVKLFEKNEFYTSKVLRREQSEKQSKSMMNSTAGSNFPFSKTHQSFNQRRASFKHNEKMN